MKTYVTSLTRDELALCISAVRHFRDGLEQDLRHLKAETKFVGKAQQFLEEAVHDYFVLYARLVAQQEECHKQDGKKLLEEESE